MKPVKRLLSLDPRLMAAPDRLRAMADKIEAGYSLGEIGMQFGVQIDALWNLIASKRYRRKAMLAGNARMILDHAIRRVCAGALPEIVAEQLALPPAVLDAAIDVATGRQGARTDVGLLTKSKRNQQQRILKPASLRKS